MIAPDMATMLSFVFTDAPIAAPRAAGAAVATASTDTFNAVTVDGDTSTSDTLLVFATGAAHGRAEDQQARATRGSRRFRKALRAACSANLAEQVARDGEGARKLVEIKVEGAASKKSARAHRACRSPTRRW